LTDRSTVVAHPSYQLRAGRRLPRSSRPRAAEPQGGRASPDRAGPSRSNGGRAPGGGGSHTGARRIPTRVSGRRVDEGGACARVAGMGAR
jgi:hypothetical protein